MNQVILIGRLTKDPDATYTAGTDPICIVNFTLAVSRPPKKGAQKGEKSDADFIRCKVFGRPAESCLRFIHKGSRVAVNGSLQSGTYQNKDGVTMYTTEVKCSSVEFLSYDSPKPAGNAGSSAPSEDFDPQQMFEAADTDVPF